MHQLPVVFMFSGQGSHYNRMGESLYRTNSVFRYWMDELDKVCIAAADFSVVDVLYAHNSQFKQDFCRTLHTHTALFMVQYSLFQVIINTGIKPDRVIGTSLGEFVSAAVAGVCDVNKLLRDIINQAKFIEKNCPDGAMISVLAESNKYKQISQLQCNSELVAINSDNNFVIATEAASVKYITSYLKDEGIVFQVLQVSHGFHSSAIDMAQKSYLESVSKRQFKFPVVKYVSSMHGWELSKFEPEYFWNVVRKPICFKQAVKFIDNSEKCVYIDLGPSGTLAGFVKKILSDNLTERVYSVMSPFFDDEKQLTRVHAQLLSSPSKLITKKRTKMKSYVFPGQGSQFV